MYENLHQRATCTSEGALSQANVASRVLASVSILCCTRAVAATEMRVKKHKATRRIVRYFKLHFGFREPFKVRKRNRDGCKCLSLQPLAL